MGNQIASNAELFVEPQRSMQFALARKGILNPGVETLTPVRHPHLYRLGHSTLSDDENLSSPWWTDYENFITLKHFAARNSISLTISSRIQNAQTPEFGPANVVYKAKLAAPLMVALQRIKPAGLHDRTPRICGSRAVSDAAGLS